jgi:hypothetical protein
MMMMHSRFAFSLLICALLAPGQVSAQEARLAGARQGLDQAFDAARTWAEDAYLIYLENDEPVGTSGDASRWGYLFHSPARGISRGYSLQDGSIRVASDLGFEFPSPPLPGQWVDSSDAFQEAHKECGREYCEKTGGVVASMFLVGGLLHPKNPEAATWAILYESKAEPGLWVVVDAESGKVVRRWRG